MEWNGMEERSAYRDQPLLTAAADIFHLRSHRIFGFSFWFVIPTTTAVQIRVEVLAQSFKEAFISLTDLFLLSFFFSPRALCPNIYNSTMTSV